LYVAQTDGEFPSERLARKLREERGIVEPMKPRAFVSVYDDRTEVSLVKDNLSKDVLIDKGMMVALMISCYIQFHAELH